MRRGDSSRPPGRARVELEHLDVAVDRGALHEGDALALHGVGDDDLAAVARSAQPLERRLDARPCRGRRSAPRASRRRANFASRSPSSLVRSSEIVRLDLVVVDDDGDLAHLPVRGGDQRFPDLALLQLAVAGDDEDAVALARRAGRRARMPFALEMPMPSEPVFVTMPGVPTSGWPGQAAEPAQAVDQLDRADARRPSARRRGPAHRGPWRRRRGRLGAVRSRQHAAARRDPCWRRTSRYGPSRRGRSCRAR